MATTDNNLQVINSMTEEMLSSLKDSSGKIPSLANQLVMTDDENSENYYKAGNGISIENGVISVKRKYITLSLSNYLNKNWNTLSIVNFDVVDNQAQEYFSVSNGQITVLKTCNIRVVGNVKAHSDLGKTTRFIIVKEAGGEICGQQNSRSSVINGGYELLSATSPVVSVNSGDVILMKYQNTYNNYSLVGAEYTNLCVEVIN